MIMKKKILALLLVSALIASVSSCGSSGGPSAVPAATTAKSADPSPSTEGARTTAAGVAAAAAAEPEGRVEVKDEAKISGEEGGSYASSPDFVPATTTIPSFTGSPMEGETTAFHEFGAVEGYFAADDYGMEYETSKDYDYSTDDYYEPRYDYDRRAGLLTGGEWRDNSNFIFWRRLFDQREDWQDTMSTWKIDTLGRIFVRVTGSDGNPGAGLRVKLADDNVIIWQTVTDSRGEAFLFDGLDPDSQNTPDEIIVEYVDGNYIKASVPSDYKNIDTPVEITVPVSAPMRKQLDLMLMMDTTGSMSDELSYLKTELKDVIDRVSEQTRADINLSVNFYRDLEDDYVVRDFGFTPNISIALDHLSDQYANGGGDYEEAVTLALKNGLTAHQWRDKSEKLMLLVLDAPPHLDDALADMKKLMIRAADMGVRIIPVASSGVDTATEYLCRSLAIATGGTYTFLTNDSGIGGSHLEPTIGSYDVEKLNDMLVRIINDYFSQQKREYNTQKPGTPVVYESIEDYSQDTYPATYVITDEYYSGDGYYTSGIIGSAEDFHDFVVKYGTDFGINYYHDLRIAYKIDLLSSGSITVDEKEDMYATVDDNGVPTFKYSLNIPEVGTTDVKTIVFYSYIPL